jgi:ribosome-associated translation inhibitor RaiA
MDSSAELFFRNMKPSQELTSLVKEQMEKLEHLYQHIIGARVIIGLANHTHRTGNVPDVHIDVQVPGHTIVVNHTSTEADAAAAVHKAFAAAAQQLKSYKQRKMGHVKSHEGGVPGEELAEKGL